MKKLLAIALVLGITAAANAVVVNVNDAPASGTYEVGIGESLVITLTSDGSEYVGLYALPAAGVGTLTGVADDTAYGSLGLFQTPADLGADYFFFTATGAPGAEPVANVPHFTFTYTAEDDFSAFSLDMLDGDTLEAIPGLSVAIQNTPEPMTLGLLGLGGLFLRRRK